MYWQYLLNWLQQVAPLFRRGDDDIGQGLVEYALILIMVAVVVVAVAATLGPGLGNIYSNIVEILGGDSGG